MSDNNIIVYACPTYMHLNDKYINFLIEVKVQVRITEPSEQSSDILLGDIVVR